MTNFTPELQTGARAMRETRARYHYEGDLTVRHPWHSKVLYRGVSLADCRDWIDCQAFAAGLEALLPVSDEIISLMRKRDRNYTGLNGAYAGMFAAAIKHITGAEQ